MFSEDTGKKHRGWSENLTFITGVTYAFGAAAGGAYGAYQGYTARPEGVADSSKLRVNRVLNQGGKLGRNAGNSCGVLGLLYSGLDSFAGSVRGVHDDGLNSILAAGGTGALYKCLSGPRAAAVWGAGCVREPPPALHARSAAATPSQCASTSLTCNRPAGPRVRSGATLAALVVGGNAAVDSLLRGR